MPRCTYCGGTGWFEGPSGGMATNILCADPKCRHWFNYLLPPIDQLDDLNRVEPTPEEEEEERQRHLDKQAERDPPNIAWAREEAERLVRKLDKIIHNSAGFVDIAASADIIEAALLAAEQGAKEECARIAEGDEAAHADCGHEDEYWDGRTDAAIAIRATLSPTSKTE